MPKKTTTIVKEEVMSHADDENSPGAKIAVLRNEVKHVNDTVHRIETKLDNMAANFVTAAQLASEKALADKTHEEFETRITSLEDDRKWIQRSVGERLINWLATAAVGAFALLK